MCASSPGALDVAKAARCRVTTYARPGFPADWSFEISRRTLGGRAEVRIATRARCMGILETGLPGAYNLENLIGVMAGRHPHRRAAADRWPGRASASWASSAGRSSGASPPG